MLTFLDRLFPYLARLTRRADPAAPMIELIELIERVVTRFRLAIRRGVTDFILPATLKEAP